MSSPLTRTCSGTGTPGSAKDVAIRPVAREETCPRNVKTGHKRTKRSEAFIEEQVLLVRDTHDAIERMLEDLEKQSQGDFEIRENELHALLNKSQEMLVMLQVMMKIRNELAYARLDLEKSIKADHRVEIAKKRVKWLHQRLEKVLATTRAYCYLNTRQQSGRNLKDRSNVSDELWDKLSKSQKRRYFNTDTNRHGYNASSTAVIDDFAKMCLQPSGSGEGDVRQTVHEGTTKLIDSKQLAPESKKKRKKKKTDERARVTSPTVERFFRTAVHGDDLYDGGGESTPEPLSDAEAEDRMTESIISSVSPGYKRLHATEGELRKLQDTALVSDIHKKVNEEEEMEPAGSPEGVRDNDYWDMDHHQFVWSEYMQDLDPRSWHALGIAVQDSFISRDKPRFESNLPWKEKPMKVNSVIDVHKIALDKLLVRLHRMYDAIGQATQATIDPIPKDEEMETVMGKQDIEGRSSTNVAALTDGTPESRDINLPPLPGTTSKTVTFLALSAEPSMTKITHKKSNKFFPRDSAVWCADMESGHNMPRLVSSKPPAIHKKTSNVQSRYLGRKPEEKPTDDIKDTIQTDRWKPTVVKRLLGVMKVMESSKKERERKADYVDYDGPKWRRVQDLLGEAGLKSPNSTIAMDAAKSIGQLNCRHPDVMTALCETISDCSKGARVSYEASRSLILLGTWSPKAMQVVIQNIKKGNQLVVAELLHTMSKAKNRPFVDKSTPEFRSLVDILVELVKVNYHELSFNAAISLGRMCVVEPVSKAFLIKKLAHLTAPQKSEALFVLIKQMNCKTRIVLEALLDHLSTSHNWKHRLEAAELLIFVGPRHLFKMMAPNEVFDVLENMLWDHANRELRYKVAEVINFLGLRRASCALVLSRLEDPSEDVRARAVISLATLGMKGGKEMKALLDLLELDSSVYVRIQVVRAFSHLKWNDPRILRSLRERERGEGTLASEARKALKSLTEEGSRN